MTDPTIDATQRSIATCSLRRRAALRCFVLRRAIRHSLPFFTTSGNSDEGASGVEASMWVGAGSLGAGLDFPCANAVEQRTIARTICLNMQTPYTFPRWLSRETRRAAFKGNAWGDCRCCFCRQSWRHRPSDQPQAHGA
jgi:hypothetical protein